MKRVILIVFMMFGVMVGLFTSCATVNESYEEQVERVRKQLEINYQKTNSPQKEAYEKRKAEHINSIEAKLNSDSQINLTNYLLDIGSNFGGSTYDSLNMYYENFKSTVVLKYQPLVDKHNNECAIKQEQKRKDWAVLALKRIPGNKDWVEYQNRYNIKTIYSSFLNNSNEVNRLRLELIMKEMSDYKKNKNLVFNKEQEEWESNNASELLKLALLLNSNFGGTYAQVQSYIRNVLYLLSE